MSLQLGSLGWLMTNRERALAWTGEQNQTTLGVLERHPLYGEYYRRALGIFEDTRALPGNLTFIDEYVYAFRQNKDYPEGAWMRASVEAFTRNPDAAEWEAVINMADLRAQQPEKDLRWQQLAAVSPCKRFVMVGLSYGGSDQIELREFDLQTLSFKEGDTFNIPWTDTQLQYIDSDTVLFGTSLFGDERTKAGFSSAAYRWERGESLAQARKRGALVRVPLDYGQAMVVNFSGAGQHHVGVLCFKSFFEQELFLLQSDGTCKRANIPMGAGIYYQNCFGMFIFLTLKKKWKGWAPDSLVAYNVGTNQAELVFSPETGSCINADIMTVHDAAYFVLLEGAQCSLKRITRINEKWHVGPSHVNDGGVMGSVGRHTATNRILMTQETPTQPRTLFTVSASGTTPIWSGTHHVNTDGFEVRREWYESGGLRIPITLFGRCEAFEKPGGSPTWLYGYGGFKISKLPEYVAERLLWCQQGSIFGIVHLPGGGEFGSAWHHAGRRENKHIVFTAMADAVNHVQHIGLASRVGIQGGSNGGLVVARTMQVCAERGIPLHAVLCTVPLYHMAGYTNIARGHNWTGELGNPDTDDWNWMQKWCPYTNARPSSEVQYAPSLVWTSVTDDRTGYEHGRIMAAQLQALGHQSLYFESRTGGHKGGKVPTEAAAKAAIELTFMTYCLMPTSN